MYLMMLLGTLIAALVLETALRDFTEIKLVQVIQATAVFTVVCNLVSLWKQEARQPGVVPYAKGERRPQFREAWSTFVAGGSAVRLLVASGLGFFAFNLQDVLLEPYGGEILGLSVSATTGLTAIMAVGAVGAFVMAATVAAQWHAPDRAGGGGAVIGMFGFFLITVSGPMELSGLFRVGHADHRLRRGALRRGHAVHGHGASRSLAAWYCAGCVGRGVRHRGRARRLP
jgi:MFS transporter, BCD family, chlorophyll transporter